MISSTDIRESLKNGREGTVLKQLYQKSLPKIVRYIVANQGCKADAEDLFQDAVGKVFYLIASENKDIDNVESFIYTSVKNRWINKMTRSKEVRVESETVGRLDFEEPEYETEEVPDKTEILEKAFAQLGEVCRELLSMFYFNKMRMDKIAEVLGFNNSATVKAKSYQCKKKLSAIISENRSFTEILKS